MFQDKLKSIYGHALEGWSSADLVSAAKNNPKATAAVVVGTGLAAAALWILREPQRLSAVRKGIAGGLRRLTGGERPPRSRGARKLP
jgi:hypothetical protein